jgi:chemotaxis protein CheX
MPVLQEINEPLVASFIVRAVGDVFNTMLGRHPRLTARPGRRPVEANNPDAPAEPQVVGTVGFVGDVRGLIYLPVARHD